MSRKPRKGYYVRGQFVAEGSELDEELRREQLADGPSKTELKAQSAELQALGQQLLSLRADLLQPLALPARLLEALQELQRITNFEGKRRQMQFVGKLMRKLDDDAVAAIQAALEEQHSGSAAEKLALHQAEHWRDRLIAGDEALAPWMQQFPDTDTQQLRALIRQARKDAPPEDKAAVSQGLAPRKGRAFRELFQLVREQMGAAQGHNEDPSDTNDEEDGHAP